MAEKETGTKVKIAMGATELPSGKMVFSHEREVDATVYGLLAVHRNAEKAAWHDRWCVTHIPTGMLVMDAPTKPHAIKAAKALQHIPWAEVTVKGIKRWKHKKAAVDAIQRVRAELQAEGR